MNPEYNELFRDFAAVLWQAEVLTEGQLRQICSRVEDLGADRAGAGSLASSVLACLNHGDTEAARGA